MEYVVIIGTPYTKKQQMASYKRLQPAIKKCESYQSPSYIIALDSNDRTDKREIYWNKNFYQERN